MSETVTEPETPPVEAVPEPAEPSVEPDEQNPDIEPDEEPIEPDEPDSEPAGAPDEPEDGGPAGKAQTEKEIEARWDKLDRENKRHAGRVGEIMGEDANALIPCPVCMDGIAGWVGDPSQAPLTPEAIARVRTVIGLPDYTTFKQAPDATTCPDCDGLGEVITGSKVPGYETKTCARCNKQGWILLAQQTNGQAHPVEPVLTGPTSEYASGQSADPEIQHLRERGFTVIPPMNIPAGA